jgi:hypothetical protein
MRRRDIFMIVIVALVSGIISLFIATAIFSSPKQRSAKVPIVVPINPNFPDVKNDPTYNVIFNSNALDPTQPVTIGGSNNQSPFNSSQ